MEAVRRYFKEQLPAYLKSLPLPKTLGGFASLTREQWIELLPFILLLFILLYLIISPLLNYCTTSKQRRPRINKMYKTDQEKVSHSLVLKDVSDEVTKEGHVSYCRCWKSATFPYCDGAHKQHNQDTGDNIGPIKIRLNKDEEHKKGGKKEAVGNEGKKKKKE